MLPPFQGQVATKKTCVETASPKLVISSLQAVLDRLGPVGGLAVKRPRRRILSTGSNATMQGVPLLLHGQARHMAQS